MISDFNCSRSELWTVKLSQCRYCTCSTEISVADCSHKVASTWCYSTSFKVPAHSFTALYCIVLRTKLSCCTTVWYRTVRTVFCTAYVVRSTGILYFWSSTSVLVVEGAGCSFPAWGTCVVCTVLYVTLNICVKKSAQLWTLPNEILYRTEYSTVCPTVWRTGKQEKYRVQYDNILYCIFVHYHTGQCCSPVWFCTAQVQYSSSTCGHNTVVQYSTSWRYLHSTCTAS